MGSPKSQVVKTIKGGWSPAYLPANYDPQMTKVYPSYPLLAEQAKTERSRPKTPFWTAMSVAAEAELTNALIGKKTPQQALKDARARLRQSWPAHSRRGLGRTDHFMSGAVDGGMATFGHHHC